MPTALDLAPDAAAFEGCPTRIFVGRKSRLLADDVRDRVPGDLRGLWDKMVKAVDPGDDGRATTAWSKSGKVVVAVVPERCSRHNTPTRAWSLGRLARHGGVKDVGICFALDDDEHAWAAAMALGRAHPTYDRSGRSGDRTVRALFLTPGTAPDTARLAVVAEARRRAAALVDMAPNELTTTALVQACREVANQVGAGIRVIEGDAVREAGLGGIWGVGKAAAHPPALVILSHQPAAPVGPTHGWVGKGIVYDTGGLSLKSKNGMVGMKGDMGGAAAVLMAFWAAVRLGLPCRITAAICIAENAIGPDATRPDDILEMYAGRTVEVNNTDAEGRLVMADGLAWLAEHHDPDVMIDCATLTGAQLVSTGKRHAALYCDSEALEDRAIEIGRRTGDLVHPLPFAPEFYRKEFASQVADLRNSVKDRANAQSSCAGQFLYEHLRGYEGEYLHVDLAGPSKASGRATGYGVGLLLGLAGLLG